MIEYLVAASYELWMVKQVALITVVAEIVIGKSGMYVTSSSKVACLFRDEKFSN